VKMGQSTTVNLYLPGHSLLLSSVMVTTQQPSGNAVSNLPPPTLAPVPGAFNKASLQPSYVNTRGRRHTEDSYGLFCDPAIRYGTPPPRTRHGIRSRSVTSITTTTTSALSVTPSTGARCCST
jgi:hypothetical protein